MVLRFPFRGSIRVRVRGGCGAWVVAHHAACNLEMFGVTRICQNATMLNSGFAKPRPQAPEQPAVLSSGSDQCFNIRF